MTGSSPITSLTLRNPVEDAQTTENPTQAKCKTVRAAIEEAVESCFATISKISSLPLKKLTETGMVQYLKTKNRGVAPSRKLRRKLLFKKFLIDSHGTDQEASFSPSSSSSNPKIRSLQHSITKRKRNHAGTLPGESCRVKRIRRLCESEMTSFSSSPFEHDSSKIKGSNPDGFFIDLRDEDTNIEMLVADSEASSSSSLSFKSNEQLEGFLPAQSLSSSEITSLNLTYSLDDFFTFSENTRKTFQADIEQYVIEEAELKRRILKLAAGYKLAHDTRASLKSTLFDASWDGYMSDVLKTLRLYRRRLYQIIFSRTNFDKRQMAQLFEQSPQEILFPLDVYINFLAITADRIDVSKLSLAELKKMISEFTKSLTFIDNKKKLMENKLDVVWELDLQKIFEFLEKCRKACYNQINFQSREETKVFFDYSVYWAEKTIDEFDVFSDNSNTETKNIRNVYEHVFIRNSGHPYNTEENIVRDVGREKINLFLLCMMSPFSSSPSSS